MNPPAVNTPQPRPTQSDIPIDFDGAIAWMNQRHALVMDGGKNYVLIEGYDESFQRPCIIWSSVEEVRKRYRRHYIERDTKRVSLGDAWIDDPRARQFDQVIFAPGRTTSPGVYNLWRGFPVAAKPGDWSLMQAHIRDVICSGNDEYMSYLLDWAAFAVQHPDHQAEIAVVFIGEEGSGKGMFCRELASLFAPYSIHASSPLELTGRFNAELETCVIFFCDEAFAATDKASQSTLKRVITEPTLRVEAKYRPTRTVRNRLHIMIASNDDWAVPAGLTARRFFVLRVSNHRVRDYPYFNELDAHMNHGGREAMLYDLQHRDLSRVNLRDVPATPALWEQKQRSMTPEQSWWFDKLREGVLLPGDDEWEQEKGRDALCKDFQQALPFKRTGRGDATSLGMFLGTVLPDGYPDERRIRGVRFYVFPTLGECRAAFERTTGTKIDWPSDHDLKAA